MTRLPLMTAAALIAGCGFANAQATNFSPTPGDAMTLGNSETRDYRSEARREAMQNRNWNRNAYRSRASGWNSYAAAPGWNSYAAAPGWNSYAAAPGWGSGIGVQVGPFGFGVGDPWHYNRVSPRAYRYHGRY